MTDLIITYSYCRRQPACEGRHLVATVLYFPVGSFFIWVLVPVISLHQFPSTSFDFLKKFDYFRFTSGTMLSNVHFSPTVSTVYNVTITVGHI